MADKKKIQGDEALLQLMEQHAQQDGQRLWQEYEDACNDGTQQPISKELDRACKEQIMETLSGDSRRERRSWILNALSRVAVIMLTLTILVSMTLSGAEADSDIHVDRFLQHACSLSEMQNRYVIHLRRYPGSEVQDVEAVSKAMSNLESKGYWRYWEYTNYRATEERPAMGLYSEYHNAQGQKIWLECRVPISGIVVVYKDGDTYASAVDCLGYNMVLVERTGSRQIFWLDDAEGLCYCLYAEGLSESDFWDLVYTLAQL